MDKYHIKTIKYNLITNKNCHTFNEYMIYIDYILINNKYLIEII